MTPEEALRRARGAALTYPEVGATAGALPAGYTHIEKRRLVGRGDGDLRRAGDLVLSWGAQRHLGFEVEADAPRAVLGADLVLHAGVGRLRLYVPCRVVRVVDEPDRQGFAYGTLPGHPETGEEAFVVERREDEAVVFTVRMFARPALWWSRLAGPLTRLGQELAIGRYVRAPGPR